jgi:hypothetical protein
MESKKMMALGIGFIVLLLIVSLLTRMEKQ